MQSDSTADHRIPDHPGAAPARPQPPSATELAAHLAARICHDMLSPVSAMISGLDLMEDDDSADMRDDAMNLIAASARKLATILPFARVAFGASASAETFDPRVLEDLTRGVFQHMRAELDWAVAAPSLNKAAARAILNLAQLGGGALPTGGVARITAAAVGDEMVIGLEAKGPRARWRPETADGLKGLALGEGLHGQWIQAYYLYALVEAAGGRLMSAAGDDQVAAEIRLPL